MSATLVRPTLPEHTTRDDEELRPDISDREMAEQQCYDGHLHAERWVVDVPHLYGWGKKGGVKMWTPCCSRVRRPVHHGEAVSCPACGWWWRLHLMGWTNRIVSLGKERPR